VTGQRRASVAGDVEALLALVDHPHDREIRALREIILGVDPRIAEGIKWNAPSFRTAEWFATFHLRAKQGVQLILHRGAKKRGAGGAIADPESLLAWLGADRASVSFRDLDDVATKRSAFEAVICQWIEQVHS
jgi:hypothetical protein